MAVQQLGRFIYRNRGNIIVTGLALIPVCLWLSEGNIRFRFSNNLVLLSSLAQVFGLVGMSLYACALILSSRLIVFDKLFGGLDRMIKTHHYIGLTAVVLLLAHPLLFAAILIPQSISTAWWFIFSVSDWPTNFGKIALLLLLSLIAITLYSPWRYEIVKNFHRLMGVPFCFAVLHVFYIPSDVAFNKPLRYYLLTLAGLGLVAYTYRTVLGFILVKTKKFKVVDVKLLGGEVTQITLEAKDQPLKFKPGQFVLIKFRSQKIITQLHPFTISSADSANDLRLSIKSSGDFTSTVKNLEIGAIAEVEGPYGGFTAELSRADKNIWIAGGIGITPFLSMARSFSDNNNLVKPVTLIHSVVSPDQAIFNQELQALAKKFAWFNFQPYYSASQGLLTAEKISQLCGGLTGTEVFLCGPPRMMKSLVEQFKQLGLSSGQVHREEFKLLK